VQVQRKQYTCALIALFKKEDGADRVKALLDQTITGESNIYLNVINLIEIYYLFYRALGKEKSAIILE